MTAATTCGARARYDPPAPTRTVRHPVLSADARTLFYRVDEAGRVGEVWPEGLYESVRADPRSPLPAGRRLRGRAETCDYVTGVSSDGLSLFLTDDGYTRVLVRTTTADRFEAPPPSRVRAGAPANEDAPPELIGWRAAPLADCERVLTTITPGGCASEDIAWLEAAPRER